MWRAIEAEDVRRDRHHRLVKAHHIQSFGLGRGANVWVRTMVALAGFVELNEGAGVHVEELKTHGRAEEVGALALARFTIVVGPTGLGRVL